MKFLNTLTPILIIALLSMSACSSDEGQTQSNEPSDIIANATFADLDGNEVHISEFRDQIVLIDFWESWCGPCLQVFPAMQELREEYPDQFTMLAVTVGLSEGPEDARAFAERHDYDFVWLYDEHGIFERLGGQGIPFKVYVNPDGELIEIEMGSRGRRGDYDKAKEKIATYF